MSIKRVQPSRPRPVPIDPYTVWMPIGSDELNQVDIAGGFARFYFPCHPGMMAPLVLDLSIDHQVWEQTCPTCDRAWRFTRSERVVRWEPIGELLDTDAEPTKGIDAWEVIVKRYRDAHR